MESDFNYSIGVFPLVEFGKLRIELNGQTTRENSQLL